MINSGWKTKLSSSLWKRRMGQRQTNLFLLFLHYHVTAHSQMQAKKEKKDPQLTREKVSTLSQSHSVYPLLATWLEFLWNLSSTRKTGLNRTVWNWPDKMLESRPMRTYTIEMTLTQITNKTEIKNQDAKKWQGYGLQALIQSMICG